MNRDSSPYERQVIDALKVILRAVGGSAASSSSSYSSSSSTSRANTSGLTTAINGISTRLDRINSDLNDIIVGESAST